MSSSGQPKRRSSSSSSSEEGETQATLAETKKPPARVEVERADGRVGWYCPPGCAMPIVTSAVGNPNRARAALEQLAEEDILAVAVPESTKGSIIAQKILPQGWLKLCTINMAEFWVRPGRTYALPHSVAEQAYICGILQSAPSDAARRTKMLREGNFPRLALNTEKPWLQRDDSAMRAGPARGPGPRGY